MTNGLSLMYRWYHLKNIAKILSEIEFMDAII